MSEINKESYKEYQPVKSRFSELWLHEDYWSIWLGLILLIISMVLFFPQGPEDLEDRITESNMILTSESDRAPFKTTAWYKAVDTKEGLKASSSEIGKKIKKFLNKPHGWTTDPSRIMYLGDTDAAVLRESAADDLEAAEVKENELLAAAVAAENVAEGAGYGNQILNDAAVEAIGEWRLSRLETNSVQRKAEIKPYNQTGYLIILMLSLGIFFGTGMKVMGYSFRKFTTGFIFIFIVAVLAYGAANQATMKQLGIGYAAWAILFGLIISNTIGTPKWAKTAVQTEYYIKTGLVLLGAEILFGKIIAIGMPGMIVAWGVTPLVLISGFIFGEKVLKIPSKTLNVTISAAYSVCGVSAAIATASACKAKKEELTLAVGLSLIFTSLMMILMPPFIKVMGMGQVLGGAWMGGTIDATGAVAAAGAFLGDKALYVSATIKMIQNVLIGIIAFFVAIYWSTRIDRNHGQKVGAIEIWHRFPKFILGFVSASVLFSVLYQVFGPDVSFTLIDNGAIKGFSSVLRGWFFCLAFVSIGLDTNFRELKTHFKGGKPFTLYFFGQSFNLILTLVMAYIAFYVVFPNILAKI